MLLSELAQKLSPTRRDSNTVQSRPRLRWGMGSLGTSQHHLASVLEYRSNQDERGSQPATFFPSVYNAIESTVYKRVVFMPIELSTVYCTSTIVLHIKCIFGQWMLVVPRERKLVLWRHSTVRPYSDSYLIQQLLPVYHHDLYSTSAFPTSGGMENPESIRGVIASTDIQLRQVCFHVVWWKCEIV